MQALWLWLLAAAPGAIELPQDLSLDFERPAAASSGSPTNASILRLSTAAQVAERFTDRMRTCRSLSFWVRVSTHRQTTHTGMLPVRFEDDEVGRVTTAWVRMADGGRFATWAWPGERPRDARVPPALKIEADESDLREWSADGETYRGAAPRPWENRTVHVAAAGLNTCDVGSYLCSWVGGDSKFLNRISTNLRRGALVAGAHEAEDRPCYLVTVASGGGGDVVHHDYWIDQRDFHLVRWDTRVQDERGGPAATRTRCYGGHRFDELQPDSFTSLRSSVSNDDRQRAVAPTTEYGKER